MKLVCAADGTDQLVVVVEDEAEEAIDAMVVARTMVHRWDSRRRRRGVCRIRNSRLEVRRGVLREGEEGCGSRKGVGGSFSHYLFGKGSISFFQNDKCLTGLVRYLC